MDMLWQDLRQAWRMLLKSPGLSIAASLSLALGIGANTTVFSFVNALLFPPLAVEQPDRLVALFTVDEKNPGYLSTSHPNYQDYRRLNSVFSDALVWKLVPLVLGKGQQGERVLGELVSGNYFSVLGVTAAFGRVFRPEEDRTPGSDAVAVLSHAFWTRRFAADPQLIGTLVTLNGHSFTIIGVAPAGFTGTSVGLSPDVWVPSMMHSEVAPGSDEWFTERRAMAFDVIARLKPGVTLPQARVSMTALARQLAQEYPKPNTGRSVSLEPLLEARINPNARGYVVLTSGFLMAIVGLVLGIACANVANLQLARASARRKEIGVRLAIGASRGQVVRQVLIESVMLALTGGVIGLGLAVWGTRYLWSLLPPSPIPIALELQPGARVLSFTLVLSVLTGIAFGLAPALQAAQINLVAVINDRRPSLERRRLSMRKLLVASQVGFSFVLLITAGLFLRSLEHAHTIDPGFKPDGVVVMSLDLAAQGFSETKGRTFYDQLVDRVEVVRGVRSATLAQSLPLSGGMARTVIIEGQASSTAGGALVLVNVVGLKYFDTLGIPVMQGRDFTGLDRSGTPDRAIVNQTMARRFWPGQSALGKRFKFWGQDTYREVTGIARDSKYASLGEDPTPYVYLPMAQNYSPSMNLQLKTIGDQAGMVATLRREIQVLDPDLPVFDVALLGSRLERSLWPARMATALLGLFGLLGLFMTVLGIYAVVAHSVAERTREIGIRIALGGRATNVLWLLIRQSMASVAVGLALGILAAAALMRLLSRLLYGIDATDPITFAATAFLLVLVTALGSYLPARRAIGVHPTLTLRHE
jgi:macrolide transport system ATP-binding/permease protein